MADYDSIPLIDIQPLIDNKDVNDNELPQSVFDCGKLIHSACKDVGFFYIKNHGISVELQNNLEELSRLFFDQPVEEKLKIDMNKGNTISWRGFFPLGREMTSGIPDKKEGLYLGLDHNNDHKRVISNTPTFGVNKLPDNIDNFRETILEYLDKLVDLAHILMRGIGIALNLQNTNYFNENFTFDPTVLFRIFNYPKHIWDDSEDVFGVREHTDYGLLTLLKQDNSGGLQVKNRSKNEWIDAPPIDNTFVINIGDMLEKITKGIYQSTPHRVKNKGNGDRLSFPFFFDPNWDASLHAIDEELLPQEDLQQIKNEQKDQSNERWDGVDLLTINHNTYGEYLWDKIGKCFPELADDVSNNN
eukprot:TRINITY_DN10813_c0_g1_i1.p1 TRINITY_DN10813_c0_g1~~TRINITY_DN10813_c0_g1_i1.p1  ORF type:complete len:359 (+),score=96.86 TRINITY_DN10813_c0_g1_i1:159-1235(+)